MSELSGANLLLTGRVGTTRSTIVDKDFNVYGPRMDGGQTMDFAHTVDIARSDVVAALSQVRQGGHNVASDTETSLLALVEALFRAMGPDLGVEDGVEDGLRDLVEAWRPRHAAVAVVRAVHA